MLHKILAYKHLLHNKRFMTMAVIAFVLVHIVMFEVKRRYAIDVIKGINFPFDDLYFYIKTKLGL
ncbi:MAG: hypothetical protein JHD28_02050 [Bacteroidia bacterium]|nr:hypothetical protein [Bacteroidia bacterium]